MIFKRKQREDPRLDITPLVDVVFLLVIFFTITTTFTTTGGIDVNLPSSSAERMVEREDKIIITVRGDGGILVDDAIISLADLKAKLERLYDTNKEGLVVIQADRTTTHGNVVQIMDAAKNVGLSRLAIATERTGPVRSEEESK